VRADELAYALPEERIARHPLGDRSAARLLVVSDGLSHHNVRDLPRLVLPGTLFVVNDTQVIKARLFGHKASGGRVELLLVRALAEGSWLAMAKSSKPLRAGATVALGGRSATVLRERDENGLLELKFDAPAGVLHWLEANGHVPLPPYLDRDAEQSDGERYQTMFARVPGAVAAPTAGLHFDDELVLALRGRGCEIASITLHVGPGTFRPVTADDLDDHPMHEERFLVPPATADAICRARARGAPVVAIGTTVVRALESAASGERPGQVRACAGETRLLIQPGYRFLVVDGLVTNFHLPRSTLLALVYAFGGTARIREAYASAIENHYRFYSYGDAMWLPTCTAPGPR
jgi:S-adenosylmethionine:tRNA ribosyltransferase-isomerase